MAKLRAVFTLIMLDPLTVRCDYSGMAVLFMFLDFRTLSNIHHNQEYYHDTFANTTFLGCIIFHTGHRYYTLYNLILVHFTYGMSVCIVHSCTYFKRDTLKI